MKVKFVYPKFQRHAEAHPELLESVPCNEYFGPPSLGIASIAAVTPPEWEIDFRDDRVEDVGLDEPVDLVAISCFTPSARRAMALADEFRARGTQVVMGGIFPTSMPDEAGTHADAVVVGEGEPVWHDVLRDAANKSLRPRYKATAPTDLSKLPLPRVDLYLAKEGPTYAPDDYPVQTSRGCPLACSACILPTSMGPKLRALETDHVLGQIAQLAARGKRASLTEDTSFFIGSGSHRRFVEILEALAAQGGPASISYIGISMPMLLTAPDSLFTVLRNAGVSMFYLVGGFDPITLRAFTGRDPKALDKACTAVRRAMDHGVEPYTSFMVGNDDDDEGTFDRMLAFADDVGIRKAEFAISTPYPSTPLWTRLLSEGRILHRDWSKYNDANVVFRPQHMSADRLLEGYLYLWREFYRPRQSLRSLSTADRTIQF